MQSELIRFRGTYRYRSSAELDRVVAAARAQLDEEDVTDPVLLGPRWLVKQGVVLTVDVLLPAAADVRFAAATLFETLAERAIEGAIDADVRGRLIDSFPSGGDGDD